MPTFDEQLEKVRREEEKFTPVEAPQDEAPAAEEKTPEDITLETFMRAQKTIQSLNAEILALREKNFQLRQSLDALRDK